MPAQEPQLGQLMELGHDKVYNAAWDSQLMAYAEATLSSSALTQIM